MQVRGAYVYATAGTSNQQLLKDLGADVAIDYRTQKVEDVISAHTLDFIIDPIGAHPALPLSHNWRS